MYTGNGTSGGRRTTTATPVTTDATSHNHASTAEKVDALSAMTVGELFRESAVRHLDPIKVLGGFSSFPERRKRGAELPQAKLSEAQVREIRHLHATTTRGERSLAREFGVSRSTVTLILRRETWAWLDDELEVKR